MQCILFTKMLILPLPPLPSPQSYDLHGDCRSVAQQRVSPRSKAVFKDGGEEVQIGHSNKIFGERKEEICSETGLGNKSKQRPICQCFCQFHVFICRSGQTMRCFVLQNFSTSADVYSTFNFVVIILLYFSLYCDFV